MTTQNTIANELNRAQLIQIIELLNDKQNLGIARVNKMSTPALISLFAKNEILCIEYGASLDYDPCFAQQEEAPVTVNTTKPGVVQAIITFVKESKGNQFVLSDIHTVLIKQFPDRNPAGLLRTIRTQVPHRLSKERGFEFVRELGMLRCLSCK